RKKLGLAGGSFLAARCGHRLRGLNHLAESLLFGARGAEEICQPVTFFALRFSNAIPEARDRSGVVAGSDECEHAGLVGEELTLLAVPGPESLALFVAVLD